MAVGPVTDDTLHQSTLFLVGCDNPESSDTVCSPGPGNIMQIQVGDRRTDCFTISVYYRCMHQRDIHKKIRIYLAHVV